MKNTMLFLFLFLFLICPFSRSNIYGAEKNKNDSIVIYFKPGTLEVSERNLDILFNKLDKSKKYIIHGYACDNDKGSDDELIAVAERRAEKVRILLLDHGFSSKNITITAYDKSPECKATVVEIDE